MRYTSRHNGYHGGLTPQELLVPLAVLAVDDTVLEGWEPVAVAPPPWWHHRPEAEPALQAPAPGGGGRRMTLSGEGEPTLFDVEALSSSASPALGAMPPTATAADAWAAEVTKALAGFRTARIRLSDDQVRRLLGILATYDGQALPERRLADLAALPAARIGRYLSQLGELVNIDSYSVLSIVGDEVRLDCALLDRQLGRA